MSSDNINLLSYAQNILAGATITTEKMILGQFISLNIIPKSDQDLTIVIQFSGDGSNWDYSVTKNITAGSNTLDTTPVVSKWMRLLITNNGVSDTTFLRVFVYGTPSNSSTLAQIAKIGNLNPVIDVGNFPTTTFGALHTEQNKPFIAINFDRGIDGDFFGDSKFEFLYNLYSYTYVTDYPAKVNFIDGVIQISSDNNALSSNGLFTDYIRYNAGVGINMTFTCAWYQAPKINTDNVNNVIMRVGLGSVLSIDPAIHGDFIGFGQGLTPNSEGTNLSIYWYKEDPTDASGFVLVERVPQTSWNLDKCDGNNILPAMDWTKLNIFKISLQYLGAGVITFYVENPSTGFIVPIHQIRVPNSRNTTSLYNTSFQGVIYQEKPTVTFDLDPVNDRSNMRLGSMAIRHEGLITKNPQLFSVNTVTTGTTTETHVLTLDNPSYSSNFLGKPNRIPIELNTLTLGVVTSANNTADYRLYLNKTITGTSYTDVNSNKTPIRYSTAGTLGVDGLLIASYALSSEDSIIIPYDNRTDQFFNLQPGSTYTITCITSGGTVEARTAVVFNNV